MKTLIEPEESSGRYSPNTGGRGRFARIDVRCEPFSSDEHQLELVDECDLPACFLQAVREGMEKLLKEEYRDVSMRVVITSHQKHQIDSDYGAFGMAGDYAIRSVCRKITGR